MHDPPSVSPSTSLEPPKLSVYLEQAENRVRIVSRQRQWGTALFLLVWLNGWTVGCLVLLGALIANFNFFMLLFALPFFAAEFFVASLVGTMIASREELLLNESGARYRWSVWGLRIANRQVPLTEIVSFQSGLHVADKENSASTTHQLVRVKTIGKELHLKLGNSSQECQYLAQLLEGVLVTLRGTQLPIEQSAAPAIPEPQELPAVLELRPPSSTHVSPPSDTSWRHHYDFDAISFTQRGGFSLSALGTLLFVNLFWNGITGVFVLGLFGFFPDGKPQRMVGMEWWFLFLFLIPFELIGLGMFFAFLVALAEPVRRSRWTLHRNAIGYRISWLGIGRSWRYEIRELDRLELRRADLQDAQDEEKSSLESSAEENEPSPLRAETQFTLAVVEPSGNDVCKIDSLSLGEACWMADILLRERRGWFVSARSHR